MTGLFRGIVRFFVIDVAPGGFQDGTVVDELMVNTSVDRTDVLRMSFVIGSGKSINFVFKGNLDVVWYSRCPMAFDEDKGDRFLLAGETSFLVVHKDVLMGDDGCTP